MSALVTYDVSMIVFNGIVLVSVVFSGNPQYYCMFDICRSKDKILLIVLHRFCLKGVTTI